MGFMSLWEKPVKEEAKEALPEIPRGVFIDESEPVKEKEVSVDAVPVISFGAKLPIDAIYGSLRESYENEGYKDALSITDKFYKETKLAIIRGELEGKFKQALLEYEGKLREVDFRIQACIGAGLIDSVEQLRVKKEIYEKHMEEIKTMRQDLEDEKLYTMPVFKSYEIGFMRGLASLMLQNPKTEAL